MSSIWSQKDPGKKFTETKEPLANTDPIEGSPLPSEETARAQPWGLYNYIYESAYTSVRFGYLSDYDTGQGQIPQLGDVPSGTIAPGGGSPSSVGDPTDCSEFTEKAFCDSDNPNDDQVEFCHGILDGCEFLRYLKETWQTFRDLYEPFDTFDVVFIRQWVELIASQSEIRIDNLSTCPDYDVFIWYRLEGADVKGDIVLTDLATGVAEVTESNTKVGTLFTGAELQTHMDDFWDAMETEFTAECSICDLTEVWVPNNQ